MKNEKHHSYELVKNIGKGNFGEVDLVKSQVDHNLYIMKVKSRKYLETSTPIRK